MKSVNQRISEYYTGRLPDYLNIKYQLLRTDPFRFFRGTCHLFYEDLAKNINWEDNTRCWITGDLHLENFGTYRGNDKVVYFDMNDFDEACFAPASWELARLLCSIHLAAKELETDVKDADELCRLCTDTYIATLMRGKPWVVDKGTTSGLLHYLIANVEGRKRAAFIKTRTTSSKKNGLKLLIDNTKTFAINEDIKQLIVQNEDAILIGCTQLQGYKIIDSAFRLAGTGSVGLERYVLLLQHSETKKLRLTDMKEAGISSVAQWSPRQQVDFKNEAERITTIQNYVQHVTPSLLHPVKMNEKHYVLKSLQPTQDRMDLQLCKKKPGQLEYMIVIMARLAASGHLRSGGRTGSSITDELIGFAEHAKIWRDEVNTYAKVYSKTVVKDFKNFCSATI